MYGDYDDKAIKCWCDSDWAGDRVSRKSVDCLVVEVLGCVVSVSTKGQAAVAQSSAEAELGGCHRAALYSIGIQNYWQELYDEYLPINICTDSSAGKMISLRRGVGAVRHLEVRQLYIQELTNSNRIKVHKVRGGINKADVGTKPHSPKAIEPFYEWLQVTHPQKGDIEREAGRVQVPSDTATKRVFNMLMAASLVSRNKADEYCNIEHDECDIKVIKFDTASWFWWIVAVIEGMTLFYLLIHSLFSWARQKQKKDIAVQTMDDRASATTTATALGRHTTVFVAGASGECYHLVDNCGSLRKAKYIKKYRPCKVCDG